MRALVQRVVRAKVTVEGRITGEIGPGLLVFLGVGKGDTAEECDYLVDKILRLRILSDSEGKMNSSLLDTERSLLVVSQFTLFGDTRKGRRPSFDQAAPPDLARTLYERFLLRARAYPIAVEAGEFQAHMMVELVNDGPVTLLCESPIESSARKFLTK